VYLWQCRHSYQLVACGRKSKAGFESTSDRRNIAPKLIIEGAAKLRQSLVIFQPLDFPAVNWPIGGWNSQSWAAA